jgi:hypothetical protein
MADYLPRADSLWSTTTWITAFSNLTAFAGMPPMSADDVYADGKTITVDTDINVATLRTTTAPRTGGSAGGGFRATHNTVIRANILAGSTTVVTFPSASPNFSTIYGNVTGSSTTASVYPINNASTGTLNITGNNAMCVSNVGRLITNSGTMNAYFPFILGATGTPVQYQGGTAILNTGTMNLSAGYATSPTSGGYNNSSGDGLINNLGTMTLSGFFEHNGSAITNSRIIENQGTLRGIGQFRANGTGVIVRTNASSVTNLSGIFAVTGSGTTHSISIQGGTSVYLAGEFSGGGGNTAAVQIATAMGAAPITIVGSVTGGGIAASNTFGTISVNAVTTNLTINADVYGGSAVGGVGVSTSVTGCTIRFNGRLIGGPVAGYTNNTGNTVYVKRAVGGPQGNNVLTGGSAPGLTNAQNAVAYVQEFEYGGRGASPVSGPVYIDKTSDSVTVAITEPTDNFRRITLFTSLSAQGLFPPVSSVRLGTVYGNGDFEGTMAVPTFSAVQVGVPVDDKIGIFVLAPESFWQFKRSEILPYPDSIGYRIGNLATIASVGQLIGSFNLYPPQSAFNIL